MAKEGYVPIAAATGSGTPSTITFTGITTDYEHLCIRAEAGGTDSATTMRKITIEFNGDTTGYDYLQYSAYDSTYMYSGQYNQASSLATIAYVGTQYFKNPHGYFETEIFNYNHTSAYTNVLSIGGWASAVSTTGHGYVGQQGVNWRDLSVVTEIKLSIESGNFTTGSTFGLYGFVGP